MQALENQIGSLESFIHKLAVTDDTSRRQLLSRFRPLPDAPVQEELVGSSIAADTRSSENYNSPIPSVILPTAVSPTVVSPSSDAPTSSSITGGLVVARAREGRMRKLVTRRATQFYGGTSLFQIQLSENVPSPQAEAEASTTRSINIPGESNDLPVDPYNETCRQLMAIFFQNLYQYNFCVYREYFLRDYAAKGGPYYSDMLMYAICAVGALVSSQESHQALAMNFVKYAEDLLLSSLDLPDLTTLQSMLILSHLEIGQGRGTKGWLFCGMACRLTHEMGLHLDPGNWTTRHESSIDREILRRVYWAVFIIDKQLSLFFGRPPALYPHEADVRNTIRIPYPPEWENLLDTYISKGTSATAFEDGISTIGSFIHQAELAKIFHIMVVDIFENRRKQTDDLAAAATAQKIHASLVKWLGMLPQKLQWSQWTVGQVPPYVLNLHMLFHTGMIILHRPPKQYLDSEVVANGEDIEICYESLAAILRLIRSYTRYYNLELLPLSFVHTLSAASGVVMMKRYLEKSSWKDKDISKPLDTLLDAMKSIQRVWPCVMEIRKGILDAIASENVGTPRTEDQTFNFSLMGMFENGVGGLSSTWNMEEYDEAADLGFLVTDEFLNSEYAWD